MKSETENKVQSTFTLDEILEVIGRFGPYHIAIFTMILFSITMTGSFALGFIFTAAEVNYRCRVTECERQLNTDAGETYNASWLRNAVPFEKNFPKSCVKFEYLNVSSEGTNDICSEKQFNRNNEEDCSDVVFDDYENTIVKEVILRKLVLYIQ